MPVDFPINLQLAYDIGNTIQLQAGRPLYLTAVGAANGMNITYTEPLATQGRLTFQFTGIGVSELMMDVLKGRTTSLNIFGSNAQDTAIGLNDTTRTITLGGSHPSPTDGLVRINGGSLTLTNRALIIRNVDSIAPLQAELFSVDWNGLVKLGESTNTFTCSMQVSPTSNELQSNNPVHIQAVTATGLPPAANIDALRTSAWDGLAYQLAFRSIPFSGTAQGHRCYLYDPANPLSTPAMIAYGAGGLHLDGEIGNITGTIFLSLGGLSGITLRRASLLCAQSATGAGYMRLKVINLTAGFGLVVEVDSDNSGGAFQILSGPAYNQDIYHIDRFGVITLSEITGTFTCSMQVDTASNALLINHNVIIDTAGGRSYLYGGKAAGDRFGIFSNTVDTTRIEMGANIDITLQTGSALALLDQTSGQIFTISRNGTVFRGPNVTTLTQFEIVAQTLTSGTGLIIAVDSDICTGNPLVIRSGPALSTPIFSVRSDGRIRISDENGVNPSYIYTDSNDTLKLSAAQQVEIDAGNMDMTAGAGYWFRPPKMTTAQRNTMVIGWGLVDAGKMWFNITLSTFEGWDGTQVVTL